jgi:hypothetical protein
MLIFFIISPDREANPRTRFGFRESCVMALLFADLFSIVLFDTLCVVASFHETVLKLAK